MKIGDAVVNEIEHLFGSDRGGNQLACRRIIVETVEALREPSGYGGPGARGEIFRLLEILHRQNAGHDRNVDAGGPHAVEIAEIKVVLEKELRHGASGA